jgi:hypothetical protein
VIRRVLYGFFVALAISVAAALPVAAADASPSPSPSSATVTDTPPTVIDANAQDRVSFGSNIHIAAGETVRDVFCMGCSVISDGTIARDLVVFGGNADIRSVVGRDAFVLGGNLHLGPKATVARDMTTVGGRSTLDPGATVGRDKTAIGSPGGAAFTSGHNFAGPDIGTLFPGVLLILLAALALALFPRQLAVTASLAESRPAASFGLGCVGILGGIALAILLAITVILIPLSLVLVVGILLAWIFGWAAIYLVVGRRLLAAADQQAQPFLAVIVGGAAFAVLTLVPPLSILIGLIAGSIALGAALGSRFGTRTEQRDFFAWGNRSPYFAPTSPMAPAPQPAPPAPPPPPAPTQPPPQEPPEANT